MPSAPTRQRTLLLAAVCFAVVGLAWLLLDWDLASTTIDGVEPQAEVPTRQLRALDQGPSPGAPPILRGDAPESRRFEPGRVRIHVSDRFTSGLSDVEVEIVARGEAERAKATVFARARTDRHGVVEFAAQPRDGSRVARVRGARPHARGVRAANNQVGTLRDMVWDSRPDSVAYVLVDEPTETLWLAQGLPLWIEVHAAEAPEGLFARTAGADPAAAVRVRHARPSFHDLSAHGQGPLALHERESLTVALEPGAPYVFDLGLIVDGRESPPLTVSGRLIPSAEVVMAVVPAHLPAQVHILLSPDAMGGLEAPKVDVGWALGRGGSLHKTKARLDARGRMVLSGVPHRVGEVLRVFGRVGERYFEALGRLAADPTEIIELRARWKTGGAAVSIQFELEVAVHRPWAPMSSSGRWPRVAGPSPRRLGRVAAAKDGIPFDVTLKLPWDVSLAEGAVVRLGPIEKRTDENGVARFRELPPGRYSGYVFGFGATQRISVDVPSAGVGRLAVKPIAGGALALTVKDEKGRPLPYAEFHVTQASGVPWADQQTLPKTLVPAKQRLDPYVGADGVRMLRYVEPGPVILQVRYGTRSAILRVEVVDEETRDGQVVLPMQSIAAPPDKKAN